MTKKPMTPEQEAKLQQALRLITSANKRLDKIEQMTQELLAEQENCSRNSAS